MIPRPSTETEVSGFATRQRRAGFDTAFRLPVKSTSFCFIGATEFRQSFVYYQIQNGGVRKMIRRSAQHNLQLI